MQYTNNSVVNITDIGTGAAALLCTTTGLACCLSTDGSHWYFPNGSAVQRTGTTYYRTRTISHTGGGTVRLNRNSGATTTGIFRCDIPGGGGLQSIYVGIYNATTGELCRKCFYNTTSANVSTIHFTTSPVNYKCMNTNSPQVQVNT